MGQMFLAKLQIVLERIGNLITSAFGWVDSFADYIFTHPLLFVFVVAVPLVGLGVGLFNRLIKAN